MSCLILEKDVLIDSLYIVLFVSLNSNLFLTLFVLIINAVITVCFLQVEFANGQAVSTISLTIRDDDVAEFAEVTYIQLVEVIEKGTNLPGRGAVIG